MLTVVTGTLVGLVLAAFILLWMQRRDADDMDIRIEIQKTTMRQALDEMIAFRNRLAVVENALPALQSEVRELSEKVQGHEQKVVEELDRINKKVTDMSESVRAASAREEQFFTGMNNIMDYNIDTARKAVRHAEEDE